MTVAGVMARAADTVTTVEVTCPLPSVAVAVTVHEAGLAGVLYRPVVAPMVPHEALQVAAALAVNCWLVPAAIVGLSGVMVSAAAAPIVSVTLAV